MDGISVRYDDTTRYLINEQFSLDEVWRIQTNVFKVSEFVDFVGTIEFKNRRCVTITDENEERNRVTVFLNRDFKPKKILEQRWHDYHEVVFKNKYVYKYVSDELVESRKIDNYGDLEMIRTIEYRIK